MRIEGRWRLGSLHAELETLGLQKGALALRDLMDMRAQIGDLHSQRSVSAFQARDLEHVVDETREPNGLADQLMVYLG